MLLSAQEFNEHIRKHWSIEKSLHWQLDVSFQEDRQRVREGNAADNFATLRKLNLEVLNQVQDKESIKNRRKMAGWSDQYLVNIFAKFNAFNLNQVHVRNSKQLFLNTILYAEIA